MTPPPRTDPEDVAAARDAAFHLGAIVESSNDAIVSKDVNGIVQSWNPAAERIFGFTAEEMIGESIRRIIPDDHQSEEDEVLKRIRAGESIDHFETIRQRKDGSIFPVSLTISPVKNDLGEIIGASKIARDITQQREVEEALKASLALKDQFLSLVSHELRTPIATVVGNAQLLLRRGDRVTEEGRERALTDIANEGQRLEDIIENLLLLSRLGASEQIPMESVDVEGLLGQAVADMERVAPGRSFVVDIEGDTPAVAGDETLVRLVLQNLLSNAHKYSPAGQPVEVTARRNERGELEVAVLDRGLGIEPEEVDRIFEAFYRAPIARSGAPGMGLGLAVCQNAMAAQGGWIRAEQRPGGGSIFRLGLRETSAS